MNQAAINNCRHDLRGIVSMAWTWAWPMICHTPNSAPTSPRFNPDEKVRGWRRLCFWAEKVELKAEGETAIGLGRWKFGIASGSLAIRLVQVQSMDNALWQSCNINEKATKISNFENWFPCQFSQQLHQFLHEDFSTPQEWGDEKTFKRSWHAKGNKNAKCEGGVLHRRD